MPFCPRCGRQENGESCAQCHTPIPKLDRVELENVAPSPREVRVTSAPGKQQMEPMAISSLPIRSFRAPWVIFAIFLCLAGGFLWYAADSSSRSAAAGIEAQHKAEVRAEAQARRKTWTDHIK